VPCAIGATIATTTRLVSSSGYVFRNVFTSFREIDARAGR
jgi:hypothetical protein